MRPRWGPHSPEYVEEFAQEVGKKLRTRWLRLLCPQAVTNRACETAGTQADYDDPSCSREALHQEWKEARNRRLSRSRTPQRQHAKAAKPCPGPEQQSDGEEPDVMALVVKKWLLKRKDGKTLRRLIDNPAAWRSGPGVSVTTSTRSLLTKRAPPATGTTRPIPPKTSQQACGPEASEQEHSLLEIEKEKEEGPMDDLDAKFVWRSMLGLESDEDYEDEQPERMPGFVNEPTWSSVYETLMSHTEAHFRTMRAALPGCMQMIQGGLQSIVDQVSSDRGIPDEPRRSSRPRNVVVKLKPTYEFVGVPRRGGGRDRRGTKTDRRC